MAEKSGRCYTEPTMEELLKSRKRYEKGYYEREEGIKEESGEEDQREGWYCKVFWTNLRVKRKERRERRMENDEGRMVGGGDEVLKVKAKLWEELGRKRDDTEPEMGDVGGHELVMCKEVSWEEVVR